MLRRLVTWCAVAALPLSAMAAQQSTRTVETLAAEGAAALKERRFADALDAFGPAHTARPDDPSLSYGAGIAAYMMGRNGEAEMFLTRTVAVRPGFTDASLLLGELQHRQGRLQDAIRTYQTALVQDPGDVTLKERLDEWLAEERVERRFVATRGAHFRFLFEGPADEALARRVVEMLESQRQRIGQLWRAYPDRPVDVVLYTQRQFQDITRAPAWAGGTYDGRIRIPALGAGSHLESLENVVVHEFVHALVAHVGGPNVPTWLNEGLAVVLEPGAHSSDAGGVLEQSSPLPLAALHAGFGGMDAATARRAYATSAVAVQRMFALRGPDATVLLLQDVAAGIPFEAAFRRRIAMPYAEFQLLIR